MPKKCRSHVKESGTQWGQYNQQNNRVLYYNPGCRINTHNFILACIKESLNKKTKETVFSWQGISNNFHRQKWSTDFPHAHGVLPSKETLEKGRGSSFTGFSLGKPDRAVLGVQSPECERAATAVSSHFDSAVTFMPSPCHRTSITGKAHVRKDGDWPDLECTEPAGLLETRRTLSLFPASSSTHRFPTGSELTVGAYSWS